MRRILLVLILGVVMLTAVFAPRFFPNSVRADADAVLRTCATSEYLPACLDAEIPKLMDQGRTMEEAFEVVAVATEYAKDKPHNYFYCHRVAHGLAAKETAKDPSAWSSVLARCPTGICSNGCLHGVTQERFRNDVLTASELEATMPEFRGACEGHEGVLTTLEQVACTHGLGHLSIYVTGADIDAALDLCRSMADGKPSLFLRTCYEGAFMQIYQPIDPEDEALVRDIAPTSTTSAKEFCSRFSGGALSACNTESWPLYTWQALTAPDALASFCALTPDPAWKSRCHNDIFTILVAIFELDPARIEAQCMRFDGDLKAQCFSNGASRLVETNNRLGEASVALCRVAEREGVGARCFEELLFYSGYNYVADSDEFLEFCEALPEPWHTRCLDHNGREMVQDILYSTP